MNPGQASDPTTRGALNRSGSAVRWCLNPNHPVPPPLRNAPAPTPCARGSHGDEGSLSRWCVPPLEGRGAASPAALTARRFRVADTSRTTRSADQPSGCLHHRPAVNGRAHSPSRLKPADPIGACTQLTTRAPGRLTAPFRGLADSARGFSPGRTAGAHTRRDLHPYPGDGVIPRPWRAGGSGTA